MAGDGHRFTFRNYGGIFQVQVESTQDLEKIDELDRARWAATSAPLDQLFADPVLLKLMDSDGNGRIRVNELIDARRWLWQRLAVRDRVVQKSDELLLAHLDAKHAEAAKIKDLATQLLGQLGATNKDRITLAEVRHFRSSYAKTFPNGDGVVTKAQLAADDAAQKLGDAVLASTGGAPDASGEPGVRAADLDLYLERVKAFVAWQKQDVAKPLGDDTAAAAKLVDELTPKVTQFFAQCALVALEDGAAARLQATPEELAKLDASDPAAIEAWLKTAPLARPNKEAVLPLEQGTNPRFSAALLRLAREVTGKVLGKPASRLTQADWTTIRSALEPFLAWQTTRPAGLPDDATAAALEALSAEPAVTALRAKIAEDQDVADELAEFQNLEKLVLYQRWLLEVANNFVAFRDLFDPDARTLFEMGTLIIDGRRVSLCMRVVDKAAHKKIAEQSLIFLIYFELTRKEGDAVKKDLVCAGVTAGERGGIDIGKRGVFYDREEKEWDATVVDLVVQPISIREAAFAPFRRLRQSIAERVEKFAASKADAVEKTATDAAHAATDKKLATVAAVPQVATAGAPVPAAAPAPAAAAAPAPAPAPAAGGNLSMLLIGAGAVFAALGSTFAFVFKTLAEIPITKTLGTLAALSGAIVVVFGFLGWLKLRRRDMSVLLEACGWALNGRMKLIRPLSLLFTQRPDLPQGAIKRRFTKSRTWIFVVSAIAAAWLALAWYLYKHPDILQRLKEGTFFQL